MRSAVRGRSTVATVTKREAAEELGATLEHLQLFGVYTNFYEGKSDHVVVFLCSAYALTGQTDGEIERFDFFRLDNLPDDTSPGSRRRIQEYIQGDVATCGVW